MADKLMLDNRLSMIYSLIRSNTNVADIGTDHGYLACYLALTGKVNHIIASDINELPLKNAKENVDRFECNDKVTLTISDGLENIDEYNVDDIVIAGMGGDVITGIINRCNWIKSSKYHLILQPMTKESSLRKFLYSEGFVILEEKCVSVGNRVYVVLLVQFNGVEKQYSWLDLVIGSITGDDLCSKKYIKKKIGYIKSCLKGAIVKNDFNSISIYQEALSKAEEMIK